MTAFGTDERPTETRIDSAARSAKRAHRPVLPERAKPITSAGRAVFQSVKEIISQRLERLVGPRAALEFAWDARATECRPNTVYVVTLHPNDAPSAARQVQYYASIGVPADRIVVVGDYRDLDYHSYATLKRTGALLRRVHDQVTDEVRSRVEKELTPFFKSRFGLVSPPVLGRRPYQYNAPVLLSDNDLQQLVERINDPNYEPADE